MTAPPRADAADAPAILRSLAAVEQERARRQAAPGLGEKVQAIKTYQQARFEHTHADLLASPRYVAAARFFLDDLYGPSDFSRRDAQFARIVPALVRLFPQEIVETVATLGELHALSESLDSTMAEALPLPVVDARAYAQSWQATGRRADREQQIDLMLEVGRSLDRYTRKPMLATSLRMMRGPARAAGLSDLQAFLERGLDTFKTMRGAAEFLAGIEARERALLAQLFSADPQAAAGSGQLP
ncbi:FFLEELY motif protein [Methylibium sp.]|uniref:FFLEELY motif protein n=1 Tax=Methylibium sp. TaxID=2067992 RepID=UPI003D0BB8B8